MITLEPARTEVISWTTAIWQALGALMGAGRLLCRRLLYCIVLC